MPCNPPLRLGALAAALGALAAAPRAPFAQPHEDRVRHGLPATRAVAPTPATRAWFAAGEFVMGADPAQLETGRALCANDLRRTAAALQTVPFDPGVTLRMRLYALRCGAEVTEGPACELGLFAGEAMAHVVWLPRFGLDRTERTVGDYARCVGAGACPAPAWPPGTPGVSDLPSLPATGVSWADAQAYCAWVGGRLPTEAEWERAARGIDGRAFAWGWTWDARRANGGRLGPHCEDATDGFAGAAPVGSFPGGTTPEGVLDLSGNVAEWVADRAGAWEVGVGYAPGRVVAPTGPDNGAERVIRGGAFDLPSYALRTTWRGRRPATTREPGVGFRCAWDP